MTNADINDLETRDYIFKIGDRGKGIQARYDENTDALIFPRAAFDYVYELIKEALSQEPTVTSTDEPMTMVYPTIVCDDAISRREALKCLNGAWGDYFILNELFERISKLPSVTQKSGKWILTIEDWNKWTCSNCGYVKRTDIHVNIGWKYCPNCGAKMESEE